MRAHFLCLAVLLAGCGGRAARKAPPPPAEEAEGSRAGSLDPLGDWEAVVANGSPADMFRYLAGDDLAAAKDKALMLRPSQRDGLTDYALRVCGRRTASWKYVIASGLPDNERRFCAWYLKTQTDYKPR